MPKPTTIPTDIPSLIQNYPLSASEGARSQYRDMIKQLGKQTTTLTVTNCKVDPAVIIISRTSPLTITNKDAVDRDITLSLGHSFTIPKKDSQSIDLSFTPGAGLYPIHCGTETAPRGILFLTP
jgi:hypothetical protein